MITAQSGLTCGTGSPGETQEIWDAVQFTIHNDFFTGRVLERDGGMMV